MKGRRDTMIIGWYTHYKGGLYYVIGRAIHTETREALVAYVGQGSDIVQVRPESMFFEEVYPGVKRFTKHDPT